MKILHTVQRYAPDVGGSEEVIRQISENLAARGHEVTVATRATPARTFTELNGVRIRQFDIRGNSIEGILGESEAFRQFIRSSEFDVMLNYAAQIWTTDLVFDLLPSVRMKKVFVPCGYSGLRDPRYSGYFAAMPEILRKYDAVVYHSPAYIDKRFADDHGLTNSFVIPNGAVLADFAAHKRGLFRERHRLGDKPIILNVSNHSWLKGHDFFWHCVPAMQEMGCTSVLIGNAYRPWPKKWLRDCYPYCRWEGIRRGVPVLEGYSRQNTIEAFLDADIFLFGSKVECAPLVMYESFASKTLFITTECGNVKDYSDIVCLVNTRSEALDIVNDFLKHPERFQGRLEEGYRWFLRELNWEAISLRYEELYRSLVSPS